MMEPPRTASEIDALRTAAYGLLRREPANRDAHLRLYEIEQMQRQPVAAIAHLRAALRDSRIVSPAGIPDAAAVDVLALSRIGPWEANIPLELVIDQRRFTVHRLYLDRDDDEGVLDAPLPPVDVVFNTIAESDDALPVLALAERLIERIGRPAINAPSTVAGLGRDGVAARFAGSANVAAPRVERASAPTLAARAVAAPLVVRPVGSQAGVGLARIDDDAALRAYLAARSDDAYYVMPFVDYASADGFYRKYRVIFVAGRPFPYHLAISPRWMIHYYNAAMAENAWMRAEEAAFIARSTPFDGRAGEALTEIAAAIPLEYFGIDCTLLADGRLLLFEADAAMLVHGTDPPELYGYKQSAFARIQSALSAVIANAR
jgi:glutathione synthase/RimK-type ligase-like ATP-grasp enzyme